jgi:hypothetical protein
MKSSVPIEPMRMNPPTVGSVQSPELLVGQADQQEADRDGEDRPPTMSKLRVARAFLTVGSSRWMTTARRSRSGC